MKLFELYQQNTLQGTNNLKLISEAVENKTGAVITVGNTQVKLGINSARYVLGLYETAVANGTSEQFLEGLANLNPTMVMENDNTMRHIVSKFKHEVKNFVSGDDLDTDLYHALFDYYSDHGEMPYGVAKGRDGDPYEWVTMRFDRDVHDYAGDNNPDVPALPSATMPSMPRQESMYEARNPWLDLSYSNTPKVGQRKRTSSGEVEYTGSGQIHRSTKRYGGDEPENVKDVDTTSSGEPAVKRGRGRPSAGVTGADESGTKFGDYSSWYHKSKRTHADRKIVGGRSQAIAVLPKGKKYLVVGKWENDSGVLLDKPSELLTLDDLKAYKSGRGRPKKVREWIETLRFVSEGAVSKKLFEGYYDLNDPDLSMNPIDLSSNPSLKDIIQRYTQLVYQGHASETSPEEDQEYDAIEKYVAQRFGEKGSAHLQKAGEVSYWGRNDKPYGRDSRSSNLGRPNQPSGDFRTTKAGKMHGQDAKMMKAKVADRLGRHPAPNLPEGTITKTSTGIKHTAKDKYGAGEEERAPQDPGKYARDLDGLNKNLTSKLDKSMGIKNDRGPKKK